MANYGETLRIIAKHGEKTPCKGELTSCKTKSHIWAFYLQLSSAGATPTTPKKTAQMSGFCKCIFCTWLVLITPQKAVKGKVNFGGFGLGFLLGIITPNRD